MSSSGSGFSQDQIEATYKVGKWISTPVSSIWLVGQVKRAFACYQRYHKDLASWDEACRTRAPSVLADGYLHQPVSPRRVDMRSDYHIEGHIPRQLAEQVGKIGVERLAAGQRRDLAKVLLAIVDQRRSLSKRSASQHTSSTSRGSYAWFEHGMRVDLPPKPLAARPPNSPSNATASSRPSPTPSSFSTPPRLANWTDSLTNCSLGARLSGHWMIRRMSR